MLGSFWPILLRKLYNTRTKLDRPFICLTCFITGYAKIFLTKCTGRYGIVLCLWPRLVRNKSKTILNNYFFLRNELFTRQQWFRIIEMRSEGNNTFDKAIVQSTFCVERIN